MLTHYRDRLDLTVQERRLFPHLRQIITFIKDGRIFEAHHLATYIRENLPEDDEVSLLARNLETALDNPDGLKNLNIFLQEYSLILPDEMGDQVSNVSTTAGESTREIDDTPRIPILRYLGWHLFSPETFVTQRIRLGSAPFNKTGSSIGLILPWTPLLLCGILLLIRGSLFPAFWMGLLFYLFIVMLCGFTLFLGKLNEVASGYIIIAAATVLISFLVAGVFSFWAAIMLWLVILFSVGTGPFFSQTESIEISKKFASGISVTVASVFTGIFLFPIDRLISEILSNAPIAEPSQIVFRFILSTAGLTGVFAIIALTILYCFSAIGWVACFVSSGTLEISIEQKRNTASIIFASLLISLLSFLIFLMIRAFP